MLSKKTDEEIMVHYQLGDAEAFAELYARYSKKVLGYLRQKAPNEAVARDVFQSTFLKLHKFRSRYDPTFPFAPWLFTICRSELLDSFKKGHHRHELLVDSVPELDEPQQAPPLPALDLSKLPLMQRRAVELRYEGEFSFEEIAARLDTSPTNARKLISRALQFLREAYEKK